MDATTKSYDDYTIGLNGLTLYDYDGEVGTYRRVN